MMSELNRREMLVGAAAVAIAANIPALPSVSAPPEIIPAWVVGTPGEFDWQHIIAKTEDQARRFFAAEVIGGDPACEEGALPDCECECNFCEKLAQVEAERKPMWDGKPYYSITPGDWLRSGTAHICSRCSYETFREEGGHGVGDEAVCEECMELADWDIVDPERAAEIRASTIHPANK